MKPSPWLKLVSKFDLLDLGEGRYELSGAVSFVTAQQILRESEKSFAGQSSIEVDLSGIQETDSAGLALLLEWKRASNQAGAGIVFKRIPEKIRAIAQTADVEELLNSSHSSSSKK
jgi:phospholipid transport system transporter-binding protein